MASRNRYFSGQGRWLALLLTTVASSFFITFADNTSRATLPFSGPTGTGSVTAAYPSLSNVIVGVVSGFIKWGTLALWAIVGTGIGDPMLVFGKLLLGYITHVYVDESAPRSEERRKRVISWGDFALMFFGGFGGAYLAQLCILILYGTTSNLGTPQVDPLLNGFTTIGSAWFSVYLHSFIVAMFYLTMVNHKKWTANVAAAVGIVDGGLTVALYSFAAGETNTATHLAAASLSSSAAAVPARGGFQAGWWIYSTASLAAVVSAVLFIRFFFMYLNVGGIGTYLANPSDITVLAQQRSSMGFRDPNPFLVGGAMDGSGDKGREGREKKPTKRRNATREDSASLRPQSSTTTTENEYDLGLADNE